ncbi:MAG TPA: protein kinase, partial [Aggregatilineales bacterium]|nr:protein kinase [Aggregatilineales bacterium]
IVELVGRGGMASVYRAIQPTLGRDVAIKVLTAATDETFVARFEREVQVIARLEHAHILPIYDYGQFEGLSFLVMRYLDGGSLHTRIRPNLPLNDVVRWVGQVAAALDYAHREHIIHRDLKPHNVLLDRQGDTYLCDFGIARIVGDTTGITKEGVAVGTPAYMAPEQWRGESVDPRADIYALGVMTFEALTGRLPFNNENVITLMHDHLNKFPPPASRFRSELPARVDLALEMVLSKRPDDRFQTATAFAEALQTALQGTGQISMSISSPLTEVTLAADEAPTLTDVVPISGRLWVMKTFETWLDRAEPPVFFLVGPHGLGKSALARRFTDILGARTILYELTPTRARSLDPRHFVATIAGELAKWLPIPSKAPSDPLLDFESRVLVPIDEAGDPVVLVIDGLETAFEYYGSPTIADVIESALASVSPFLRWVVTSAPDARLDQIFYAAERVELFPDSDENRADVRGTLLTRFHTLLPRLGSVDLGMLEEKSEGNPLYLTTLLDALGYKRLAIDTLAGLPAGLEALYHELEQRAEEEHPGAGAVLYVLAAAQEPLPVKILADIFAQRPSEIEPALLALRPLVMVTDGSWLLAHRAVSSCLAAQADELRAAHQRIAQAWDRTPPQQMPSYALEHVPIHCLLAGKIDRAVEWLTDLNYLDAWLGDGEFESSVFDLVRAALTAEPTIRVLEKVQEAARGLDRQDVFSALYDRLVSVPELQGALGVAVSKRRSPWLRRVWPVTEAPDPGTILASGEPVRGFAQAGQFWLISHADSTLQLWSEGQRLEVWPAPATSALALSDDGQIAATGSAGGTITLWNTATHEPLKHLARHQGQIFGLAIWGKYILSAGSDRLLLLWNWQTGAVVQTFFQHPDAVTACGFGAGGAVALSGCADGDVRLWSLPDGRLLRTIGNHRGAVRAILSLDEMVITGADDHVVRVWSRRDGTLIRALSGHNGAISGLAIDTKKGWLVSGSEDGSARVWAMSGGKLLSRFDAGAPVGGVGIAGEQIIVGAGSKVAAWTARVLDIIHESHAGEVTCCALGPTGLLTGSLDRELRWWDVSDGRLRHVLRGHTGGVTACAIRADERMALSAASDGTLRLWNLAYGFMIRMLTGEREVVRACALSPTPLAVGGESRAWLAAAGDRQVRLWDVDAGRLLASLPGHKGALVASVFDPTEPVVATASRDRTIRIWSLALGEPLQTLTDAHIATACAFSPDGAVLLVGFNDGRLVHWEWGSGVTRTLQASDRPIIACGMG